MTKAIATACRWDRQQRRWPTLRTTTYGAMALAMVMLLLHRVPLHAQAASRLSGRMVLEETYTGPAGFASSPALPQPQPQLQQPLNVLLGKRWRRGGQAAAKVDSDDEPLDADEDTEEVTFEKRRSITSTVSRRNSGSSTGGDTGAGDRWVSLDAGSSSANRSIWLYSLIPADYDGAAVLPHWIRHYLDAGLHPSNVILLVNHNPEKYTDEGLRAVESVLKAYGVKHRVWEGQYSSDRHLKQKLMLFNELVTSLNDWILIADSDEFQDYMGVPIPQFLDFADAQGASYIRGEMVDRVTDDGSMPAMAASPSIYEQFPLRCKVVGRLYGGKTTKIAAFKAYLRSNQGNHKIVPPEQAAAYFAGCEPGEVCPRGGFYGQEDLFALTPYARFPDRYVYRGTPANPEASWDDYPSALTVTVFHFKWHIAVLQNLRDRLQFYKGNVDDGGLPRFRHYREAETVLQALAETNHLNLTGMGCTNTLALTQRRREQLGVEQRQRQLHLHAGHAQKLPSSDAQGAGSQA